MEIITSETITAANAKPIIEYLIPLIAVAVTYIFGRLESAHSYKKETELKRYQAVYVPFIRKLYAGRLWEIPFGKLNVESRSVFLDLIMNNLEYLGVDTLEHVSEFYMVYLDMLEFEDDNPNYKDAPTKANEVFRSVTISILLEAEQLAKRLKLPPLGATLLTKFSQ